jgi:DNA-binding MltR family transcriptional regulator
LLVASVAKEKFKDIRAELNAQTDRGAGIIGAGIIDEFLTDLLKKRLILTAKVRERLFSYEVNGPLAHFAAKIDMAFALGLIDTNLHADLHDIRRIRNRFAHTPEPLGFSDKEISKWCSRFRTVDDFVRSADLRTQYLGLCAGISAFFAASSQLNLRLQDIRAIPEVRDHMARILSEMKDKALKRVKT